ncbi:alpha-soluble NSF attachment protein [Tanacetum coccineum]
MKGFVNSRKFEYVVNFVLLLNLKVLRLTAGYKYYLLGKLSSEVGWNHYETIKKAIEIYEEIARESLNSNLLKYGVRGHLLNAGIFQLCKGDVVAITNALGRYQGLDPTFSGTREYNYWWLPPLEGKRSRIAKKYSPQRLEQTLELKIKTH